MSPLGGVEWAMPKPDATTYLTTALLTAALTFATPSGGAEAPSLFRSHGASVVQVRLIDETTRAKSSIGSGFFVAGGNLVVTNYHVVSEKVFRPRGYLIEIVEADGTTGSADISQIDVVHDLALLSTKNTGAHFLELSVDAPLQGASIYSVGNPYDLGSSIVEGTYNGLLSDRLFEKVHFSGSLNPGMSGGPTIAASGRVVGINVSTAGNDVSFLVPAKFAAAMISRANENGGKDGEVIERLRLQLLAHQESVTQKILEGGFETKNLGYYGLPVSNAAFFKCWGATDKKDDQRYQISTHQCRVEDGIYLAEWSHSGTVEIEHAFFRSDDLNRWQFYALFEEHFSQDWSQLGGSAEHVAAFSCNTEFVEINASTFKVVLCARGYRKLTELYDFVLRTASLNEPNRGVQSKLTLAGFSYVNGLMLVRRYLESITWTDPS